ncbi:ABC transporter permease [Yinghuangia sp. YIM S09857]|uniref:ABC transporter permease n=1 Tax=Yinghuangia sp. YIM S09857 TaxID=3436929 RepID=UPI003F52D880
MSDLALTSVLDPDPATTSPQPAGAPASGIRRRRIPTALFVWGAAAALLVLVAAIGPWLVGDTHTSHVESRLRGIGEDGHWLGTDGQGRDVLARVVAGARPSLVAGLVPVLVAGVLGTALGVAAGMARRTVHTLVMRGLDVLYAFPAILLAIAISAALGSGVANAVIALSIVLIPPVARVAEAETVRLTGMNFMDSAFASGAGRATIALRQVMPNLLPVIVVYCTTLAGMAVVFAAGLSFLGLGVAPPNAEWGLMVGDLRNYVFAEPALSLVPAAAILLASVTFNALGDALRDHLDVRKEVFA